MSYKVSEFDPEKRAVAKQASRDEDARRLAAGEISQAELKRENSFFGSLDMSNFKMVAIGDKPINRPDAHAVGERTKLIRDRLIARRIVRDPSILVRTRERLAEEIAKTDQPAWWALEWLEILNRPVGEVAAFVRSTDEHARRLASASPFIGMMGDDVADPVFRKRVYALALKHFGWTIPGLR